MATTGLFGLLLCIGCTQKEHGGEFFTGRSYYFNNAGNDAGDGTRNKPFKTIEKLNSLQLQPGDSVFFEGGQTFAGSILIDSNDAGVKESPLVITSSGGTKAIINGGTATALTLHNTGFLTLRNLSFEGAGRNNGNNKDGVIINSCHDVTADSLSIKGFQKAGLLVYSSNEMDISNVHATENGFAGISISGAGNKTDCKNIRVAHCTAENNPGDPTNLTNHSGNGIVAGYCKNVTIEYCAATNNGWDMPRKGNGPVGIWCFEADSVIIQHCISYKNKTAAGAADGGGFDFDGGVTNSIIQYCLSYENEGSAFGLFQYAGASNWYNNTVRHCISENDGSVSAAHAGIFVWNSSGDPDQLRNCYVYNNTIYNTKGAAISYEPQSAHKNFYFYNNIFVGRDSLIIGKESGSQFIGNNWYSINKGFNIQGMKNFQSWATIQKQEMNNGMLAGFNIDPEFINAGNTNIIDPMQLKNFNHYNLPAGSVLRTGGINLQEAFGIDSGGKTFNQQDTPLKGIGACF